MPIFRKFSGDVDKAKAQMPTARKFLENMKERYRKLGLEKAPHKAMRKQFETGVEFKIVSTPYLDLIQIFHPAKGFKYQPHGGVYTKTYTDGTAEEIAESEKAWVVHSNPIKKSGIKVWWESKVRIVHNHKGPYDYAGVDDSQFYFYEQYGFGATVGQDFFHEASGTYLVWYDQAKMVDEDVANSTNIANGSGTSVRSRYSTNHTAVGLYRSNRKLCGVPQEDETDLSILGAGIWRTDESGSYLVVAIRKRSASSNETYGYFNNSIYDTSIDVYKRKLPQKNAKFRYSNENLYDEEEESYGWQLIGNVAMPSDLQFYQEFATNPGGGDDWTYYQWSDFESIAAFCSNPIGADLETGEGGTFEFSGTISTSAYAERIETTRLPSPDIGSATAPAGDTFEAKTYMRDIISGIYTIELDRELTTINSTTWTRQIDTLQTGTDPDGIFTFDPYPTAVNASGAWTKLAVDYQDDVKVYLEGATFADSNFGNDPADNDSGNKIRFHGHTFQTSWFNNYDEATGGHIDIDVQQKSILGLDLRYDRMFYADAYMERRGDPSAQVYPQTLEVTWYLLEGYTLNPTDPTDVVTGKHVLTGLISGYDGAVTSPLTYDLYDTDITNPNSNVDTLIPHSCGAMLCGQAHYQGAITNRGHMSGHYTSIEKLHQSSLGFGCTYDRHCVFGFKYAGFGTQGYKFSTISPYPAQYAIAGIEKDLTDAPVYLYDTQYLETAMEDRYLVEGDNSTALTDWIGMVG